MTNIFKRLDLKQIYISVYFFKWVMLILEKKACEQKDVLN